MKKIILLTAFLWNITSAYSQHSTCTDAIPVTDSYGPVTAHGFADPSLCDKRDITTYMGKPHKVVWFSFVIPYDMDLTFLITPERAGEDFDFMLFKATGGNFCDAIQKKEVKPIRTNFAKPTEFSGGKTGLSKTGKAEYVPHGYNSPWSSSFPVKKGEVFYLAVDNYKDGAGGFTLKLFNSGGSAPVAVKTPVKPPDDNSSIDAAHAQAPRIAPDTTPSAPVKAPKVVITQTDLNIHVLDSANHPVKATLIIDGLDDPIKVDAANYTVTLKTSQSIKIRANADGHMPYQGTYSFTGDSSSATFLVRLLAIKSSENFTLKDINFEGNSNKIRADSKPALDYILQFLTNNKNVKITIKGFTNDPDNIGTKQYDKELSEKRAGAIKDYLTANGVDAARIQCIGYGNTKLIYPHPINEEQKVANRRVEIEIQ